MNQISNLTKQDLFEVIFKGYNQYDFLLDQNSRYFIKYYGRLSIPEFLNRLYKLKELPSLDTRYDNAETDIHVHVVVNNDYPYNFILNDKRFNLESAEDETLLNFICEMFHPEVREDNSCWPLVKNYISNLLFKDGYEIIVVSEISGREVFGWRNIRKFCSPFSVRFEHQIKNQVIKFKLSYKIREQILSTLFSFDEVICDTTETGFNYTYKPSDKIIECIKSFYQPKCFDSSKKFVDTESLQDFIRNTRPYGVFDAIEFFSSFSYNYKFEEKINLILASDRIPYQLEKGLFVFNNIKIAKPVSNSHVEKGVKELIEEAFGKYESNQISDAVEKLWDALERIKTVLIPENKKRSSDLLIQKMADGDNNFYNIYKDEITLLTKIGNEYRIRHHETNKHEIKNILNWEYLFNRCSSFLEVAIKYIN